jgi:hypothetical protein
MRNFGKFPGVLNIRFHVVKVRSPIALPTSRVLHPA